MLCKVGHDGPLNKGSLGALPNYLGYRRVLHHGLMHCNMRFVILVGERFDRLSFDNHHVLSHRV